jgi:hypothetical protein
MNIDNVEKKLREAGFFLDLLRKQERKAFGDREPFDFFLSAFLNACRTVDYRLRHEQAAIYPAWRNAWDKRLLPYDSELIRFMVDDRNVEVHESGSGRSSKLEGFEVAHSYSDESGTLEVSGVPVTLGGSGPRATVYKPSYTFTINGIERGATEVCDAYLNLLKQMIASLKATNP